MAYKIIIKTRSMAKDIGIDKTILQALCILPL